MGLGDGAVVSELVVDGRCLAAFLVGRDEGILAEFVRSECSFWQAG